MNNEGFVVSFIWKDRSAQSLDYILINFVFNPLERHSRSAEILVSVSIYLPGSVFFKRLMNDDMIFIMTLNINTSLLK